MSEPDRPQKFIPALRFRMFTQFYDRLVNATMKEGKFRGMLLAQANVQPGHRVLDIGCGTGTFAILLKQSVPEADEGVLPSLMQQAGFNDVAEIDREMTAFGRLSLYRGVAV